MLVHSWVSSYLVFVSKISLSYFYFFSELSPHFEFFWSKLCCSFVLLFNLLVLFKSVLWTCLSGMLSLFVGKLFCSLFSFHNFVWNLTRLFCLLINFSHFLERVMIWGSFPDFRDLYFLFLFFLFIEFRTITACFLSCFPSPPLYKPCLLFIFTIPALFYSDAAPSSYYSV